MCAVGEYKSQNYVTSGVDVLLGVCKDSANEEVAKELRTIEYDIKKAKDAHNVFLKELGLEQLP